MLAVNINRLILALLDDVNEVADLRSERLGLLEGLRPPIADFLVSLAQLIGGAGERLLTHHVRHRAAERSLAVE